MGGIADAVRDYAQPLLDRTDGSMEQVKKAFTVGQICWNLAVTPEAEREKEIASSFATMGLSEEEAGTFRREVVEPMIRRHVEMFPGMHRTEARPRAPPGASAAPIPPRPARAEASPGTGRNEPCPCGSGRKYKHCCGG